MARGMEATVHEAKTSLPSRSQKAGRLRISFETVVGRLSEKHITQRGPDGLLPPASPEARF